MTEPNLPQEFKLINIREVWPGEAKDFTPWLADNLETLSAHLEISDLELESSEVDGPGGRRLDILAKDADGRNWAVENQYGEADHDHLTRARAVIVVAESGDSLVPHLQVSGGNLRLPLAGARSASRLRSPRRSHVPVPRGTHAPCGAPHLAACVGGRPRKSRQADPTLRALPHRHHLGSRRGPACPDGVASNDMIPRPVRSTSEPNRW